MSTVVGGVLFVCCALSVTGGHEAQTQIRFLQMHRPVLSLHLEACSDAEHKCHLVDGNLLARFLMILTC